MRSGLMIGTSGAFGAIAAEARRAEQLGFDLLASGEHVFFHGPTSNAFLTLATAAGVTERVRLLSALTILPLYPMAMAAKMASTLDLISNGRFDLGIGVGGEYPPEFAAVGAPVVGRGSRTDEALEVMVRLLSGERVIRRGAVRLAAGPAAGAAARAAAAPAYLGGRPPDARDAPGRPVR